MGGSYEHVMDEWGNVLAVIAFEGGHVDVFTAGSVRRFVASFAYRYEARAWVFRVLGRTVAA